MSSILDKLNGSRLNNITPKDKRHITILLIILGVSLTISIGMRIFRHNHEEEISERLKDTALQSQLAILNERYQQALEKKQSAEKNWKKDYNQKDYRKGSEKADTPSGPKEKEKPETKYFCFDPNGISEQDFIKLGFSDKQASSFVKYRQKGKKFYVADDVLDAYCFDDRNYPKLKNYIKINLDSLTNGGKQKDLNTAALEELMECGLTEQEAQRAMSFRDSVGYFYAPWQLSDCIGYKRGNKLKDNFYICHSVSRRMINVNQMTAAEMTRNPYISPEMAGKFIAQRSASPLTSHSDAVKSGIVDEKTMKKLANYLEY